MTHYTGPHGCVVTASRAQLMSARMPPPLRTCRSCSAAQIGKIVQWLVEGTSGVGHKTDLAGTPYSLSEDFVSSYRMHPLLPDDLFIAGDEVGFGWAWLPPQLFYPVHVEASISQGLLQRSGLLALVLAQLVGDTSHCRAGCTVHAPAWPSPAASLIRTTLRFEVNVCFLVSRSRPGT